MYKKIQEYNINAVSVKMFEHIDDDMYVVVCNVCVKYHRNKNCGYPVVIPETIVSMDCNYDTAQKIFSETTKAIYEAMNVVKGASFNHIK